MTHLIVLLLKCHGFYYAERLFFIVEKIRYKIDKFVKGVAFIMFRFFMDKEGLFISANNYVRLKES